MSVYRQVLDIVNSSQQPLGWHGIATRLSMKGIILDRNLVSLLGELEERGLVKHETLSGYPHGIYIITSAGQEFLRHEAR
jgi:hypothetical protein